MTESLLAEMQDRVEEWTLIPSAGGVFEVELDGQLIFSKKLEKRHTTAEELRELLAPHLA